MSRWCIDEIEVVHNASCRLAEGRTRPYSVKLKTNEEMLANLARVDTAHGHEAPSVLAACEGCIPVDDNPEAP